MIPNIAVMHDWLDAFGDLAIIIMAFFVYKIMTNHLPSIERRAKKMGRQISFLFGRTKPSADEWKEFDKDD